MGEVWQITMFQHESLVQSFGWSNMKVLTFSLMSFIAMLILRWYQSHYREPIEIVLVNVAENYDAFSV